MWTLAAFLTLAALVCAQTGLSRPARDRKSDASANRVIAAIAEARALRESGHYEEAIRAFSHAAQVAHAAADTDNEAQVWVAISGCNISLWHLRDALTSAQTGYRLASLANDSTWAGAAAANIAMVYRQLGDFSVSENYNQQAIRLFEKGTRKDFLARGLFHLGQLYAQEGRFTEAIPCFDKGIGIAHAAGFSSVEALIWNERAFALIMKRDSAEAARSLDRAEEIEQHTHDKQQALTDEYRAQLEFERGNYHRALELVQRALPSKWLAADVPAYYSVHLHGQILAEMGETDNALTVLRHAVDLADAWRRDSLPGDITSTRTIAYLDSVYRDYAQLGAETALARHNPDLSRAAFEALSRNRAASLREQLMRALVEKSSLGDRYFQLLSELEKAQARVTLTENSREDEAKLSDLRLKIDELENQNQNLSSIREKSAFQNSLRDIQQRLGANTVLLSFCLGKKHSFLWAVTEDNVSLYQLAAEHEIEQRATSFSNAVRNGRDATAEGRSLSALLFGQLNAASAQKRDWLMVGDGILLNRLPYAALPSAAPAEAGQKLIANHSIRCLPSELLQFVPSAGHPERRFLGIADPIYNLADSRLQQKTRLVPASNLAGSLSLARLVGSDREVRGAAKLSGMPELEILSGNSARPEALEGALKKRPALIHIAVHVVSPEGRPEEAALALSLGDDNLPALIPREVIATYHVPGSLVVLSGCSSGQGRAVPSAGLIGLSRAWLLAGASAVIVSSWPTPDDSGPFFSSFYKYLQSIPDGRLAERAAAALRQTQLEMQQSRGYRSSPSFWAAYSIVSKE